MLLKRIKSNEKLYKTSVVAILAIVVFGFGIMGFKSAFSSPSTGILLNDQEVGNLKFKNARFEENKLIVEVEAKEKEELSTIDVIYKDKSGNEITRVSGYIGNEIEKEEVKKLVVDTDEDLSNINTVEYIINK